MIGRSKRDTAYSKASANTQDPGRLEEYTGLTFAEIQDYQEMAADRTVSCSHKPAEAAGANPHPITGSQERVCCQDTADAPKVLTEGASPPREPAAVSVVSLASDRGLDGTACVIAAADARDGKASSADQLRLPAVQLGTAKL